MQVYFYASWNHKKGKTKNIEVRETKNTLFHKSYNQKLLK